MRAVVDANVFVSAAIRTGSSHRVIQAWLEREAFELVICPRLLAEVAEALVDRVCAVGSLRTSQHGSSRRSG